MKKKLGFKGLNIAVAYRTRLGYKDSLKYIYILMYTWNLFLTKHAVNVHRVQVVTKARLQTSF